MRAVSLCLLLLAVLAAPAAAQAPLPTPTPTPGPSVTPTPTPTPEPTIAPGIRSGGVALGGLTVAQAQDLLQAQLGRRAVKPVFVVLAGHRYRLRAKTVKVAFDANRTARRAYQAGVRTPPASGAVLNVPLAIAYSRTAVSGWVDRLAAKVAIAPRDASIRYTLRHIKRTHSHKGRALRVRIVRHRIERALTQLQRNRVIHTTRKPVRPRITAGKLGRVYPTIITVDRAHFRLRLFKHLRIAKRYTVAVGQPAYPTPTGLFSITDKQVNPTWTAPNSPWAGELAGQSFDSSDPGNPLKARWMGIVNGVGIHGTGEDYSIGSAASHGCIRMHVWDVIDLYPRVPVGTPVYIR